MRPSRTRSLKCVNETKNQADKFCVLPFSLPPECVLRGKQAELVAKMKALRGRLHSVLAKLETLLDYQARRAAVHAAFGRGGGAARP